MEYIRIQLLAENKQMLRQQCSDLEKFASLFRARLHKVQVGPFADTFLIELPKDECSFCHLVNAVNSFCHFHGSVYRFASEKITVSMQEMSSEFVDISLYGQEKPWMRLSDTSLEENLKK